MIIFKTITLLNVMHLRKRLIYLVLLLFSTNCCSYKNCIHQIDNHPYYLKTAPLHELRQPDDINLPKINNKYEIPSIQDKNNIKLDLLPPTCNI